MRLLHLAALMGISFVYADDVKPFAIERVDNDAYDVALERLENDIAHVDSSVRDTFKPAFGEMGPVVDHERLPLPGYENPQGPHKAGSKPNRKGDAGKKPHEVNGQHHKAGGKPQRPDTPHKHAGEQKPHHNQGQNMHSTPEKGNHNQHGDQNQHGSQNQHKGQDSSHHEQDQHKKPVPEHHGPNGGVVYGGVPYSGKPNPGYHNPGPVNGHQGSNQAGSMNGKQDTHQAGAVDKPPAGDSHKVVNLNHLIQPAASPQEAEQQAKAPAFVVRPVGDDSSSCVATITSTVTLPQSTMTVTYTPDYTTTSTTMSSSTTDSSMVITPPATYTTSAHPSACTGTSAQCPCESGYSCLLVGQCEWECIATATPTPTSSS